MLAVDAANVYWTTWTSPNGTVMRTSLDGAGPLVTIASGQNMPLRRCCRRDERLLDYLDVTRRHRHEEAARRRSGGRARNEPARAVQPRPRRDQRLLDKLGDGEAAGAIMTVPIAGGCPRCSPRPTPTASPWMRPASTGPTTYLASCRN